MSKVEGFILAGGASSRMRTEKARLKLGGRSMVERVAGAARGVTSSVSLVSSKPGAEEFGLPLVRDLYEERGPLGGLHAAMARCRAEWALVLSCDLPFVTAGLLARLASLRGPEFDAVVPVQPDGRMQPLCALYAVRICFSVVEDLIKSDVLKPRALLDRIRTRRVAFAELRDLRGSEDFFRNVNTPEEYRAARLAAGETD
jgi:molybdopterin-guanine dinucleotide biosynthesis protein A